MIAAARGYLFTSYCNIRAVIWKNSGCCGFPRSRLKVLASLADWPQRQQIRNHQHRNRIPEETLETETARDPTMSMVRCSAYHRSYGEYGRPLMRNSEGATRMPLRWPETFPTELVFEVFKYLPQGDLANACRVSRYCIQLRNGELTSRVLRSIEYVVVVTS